MISLLIDGQTFDILQTSKLKIPSYTSAIKVDDGGYTSNTVRGTGYNSAEKSVSFSIIINSYQFELFDDLIDRITRIFVWNPRRSYVLVRTYQGKDYQMMLTAPKYTIPEITNLRYLEVPVSFKCMDNYFIAALSQEQPFSTEMTFDSIIDVPITFKADILMQSGVDFPFTVQLGETGGNYIKIEAIVPKAYSGNNTLTISNSGAFLGDYDLTAYTIGSLPLVSNNVSFFLEMNTLFNNAVLSYRGGIL